ncbi:MAG: NAD(+) synthase [Treponemataceae bacterium]|nr:NAD(+) synthase [Treponemataceae bacterium]
MKNNLIAVAAVVPPLHVADVKYNTEQIISAIKTLTDCGVIVFPELSVTGYTCADLFESDLLLNAAEEAVLTIAKATENTGVTAVVGLPIRFKNNLYNCAAILSEGVVKAFVPKTFIPNYSEFYECRWFASGKDVRGESFLLSGQKIPFGVDVLAEDSASGAVLGIEICEDLWIPDKPSTHAALAGANILVNLSASDELIGKQEYRTQLVKQQSGACYCTYIYVSAGTHESSTDLVFSGHTILAQNGSLIGEAIFPEYPHTEKVLVDLGVIMHDRRKQNTFENAGAAYRRVAARMQTAGVNAGAIGSGAREASAAGNGVKVTCANEAGAEDAGEKNVCAESAETNAAGADAVTISEMAEILKKYNYPMARNPFVPAENVAREERCRRILQIQANGLATRVHATGIKNLIIGISGGLDSTLALLVCAEARKIIPDIRIVAYTLPNQGNTTDLTLNNAKSLMKLLADESHEISIGEGVNLHLKQLGHELTYQGEGDVTYENAQARMRTYILMDAANMKNGLVVGTGDLSELALGWCTYNGDHMSMYAVNASVPKTLVKYICVSYAMICGSDELKKVLLSICDTPITPELTPSEGGKIAQMTEEKIGKYDLNDFFLFYTLRYGFEPSRAAAYALYAYPELSIEKVVDAAKNFYKRFFSQQFKRSCLPDGPKVGSVTLSPRGDWRMPSDAKVALWLQDLEQGL